MSNFATVLKKQLSEKPNLSGKERRVLRFLQKEAPEARNRWARKIAKMEQDAVDALQTRGYSARVGMDWQEFAEAEAPDWPAIIKTILELILKLLDLFL